MTRKRPTPRPNLVELLGETAELAIAPTQGQTLPVMSLEPGALQPRRNFDAAGLERLAESIRREGILQPLLVRPSGRGHEIVAGERRWRAAQLAGLTEVPVVVRTLSDDQARVAALVENLQREDLNLLDEVEGKLALAAAVLGLDAAAARTRLVQLTKAQEAGPEHASLDEAFAGLGEGWPSFAKNKLRVLNWPAEILDAIRGGLAFTTASMIVGAPPEHHAALLALAQGGAGAGEVQAEVRRLQEPRTSSGQPQAAQVARVLGSRRFLERLTPEDGKALERWLAKMPTAVRDALKP